MRYQFEFNDTLTQFFDGLEGGVNGVASAALYKGAGVVADAISGAISGIQTEPYRRVNEGDPKRKPSPEEKAVLGQGHFGIAKFRKGGAEVTTSIGMGNSGYGSLGRSGKSVPVPVIARSIDSGTSFMQKQPFLRKALNTAGKEALAVIEAEIDSRFQSIIDRHK